MKTSSLVNVCGYISKKESLMNVNHHILNNTYVVEANIPYSGYYGMIPGQANPNSLFLLTAHQYSLDEVLRYAQNIDSCIMEEVDVSTASLDFFHHKYAAIRVKHFPDYEHIHLLQNCCIKQGVEFAKKVHVSDVAQIRVNKCFVLEELAEGIYFDRKDEHKGYLTIPKQITDSEFTDILIDIRNNTDCKLFDAALGAMIIDSRVMEIVRIYSENIEIELLKCIKERFVQAILNNIVYSREISIPRDIN